MTIDAQAWRLIGFVCTASAHTGGASSRDADKLTIHGRSWAFCPHDTQAEGHIWSPSTLATIAPFGLRAQYQEAER
jgi:hypothetical protein